MSVSESVTPVPPLLSFTVTLLVSNDISEFTYQIALTHKCAPLLSMKMKQKQNIFSALSTDDSYIPALNCSCLLNFEFNDTRTK